MKQLIAMLEKYGPGILENLSKRLEIETELYEMELEDAGALADTHRIYSYFAPMEVEPVKECIDVLGHWTRRDDGKDITILLNSPGGYCEEGFALYDFLLALRKYHKRHLEIVGLGQVSSMAGIVIQAASKRVMHKNAWFLIHEVATGMPAGYYDQKLSNIEDELATAKRMELQGTKILASRSNATVQDILEKTYKRDWWLSSKEALEWGFVDEVR